MPVLVIDTCLAACQVGVFEGGRMLAGKSEPMERGHQERLAPMVAEVMAAARVGGETIAVTIGPGSFTGLRVGLAFAKGLRLATSRPLVGLGSLEALAASAGTDGPVVAAIDARRSQIYIQAFEAGHPLTEPDILPLATAAQRLWGLERARFTVIGSGAAALAELLSGAEAMHLAAPDLAALGRLAEAATPTDDVHPLYLRAPDARPMAP